MTPLNARVDEQGNLLHVCERCESALTRGESRAVPIINLDAYFNDRHLLELARTLSLPDVTALLEATRQREQGLAEARAGALPAAWRWIHQAESACAAAGLSEEAAVVADSFQHAAIAFLYYRQSAYEEALDALHKALGDCVRLREEFAYCVEVRRIHLLRNVVRVMTVAGAPREATLLALALIRYVEGTGKWPSPEGALHGMPDALSSNEREAMLDQVLGEITFATSRAPAVAEVLPAYPQDSRQVPSRVDLRLLALRAYLIGDFGEFLRWATIFFSEGPSQMPASWHAMVKCYRSIRDNLDTCTSGELTVGDARVQPTGANPI